MAGGDEQKTNVFQMRVAAETMAKVDDLRKAEDDLPSRAEMIRRLIEAAHQKISGKPRKR